MFAFVLIALLSGGGPPSVQDVDGVAGPALALFVRDAAGQPVAGAEARLNGRRSSMNATTDASGRCLFEGYAPGQFRIEVVAPRFRAFHRSLRLGATPESLSIDVGPPRFQETIAVVEPAAQVPFSTFLTAEQIDDLPDDPEELSKVLSAMAGPGAVFRVNGFTMSRLPAKSQIKSIRIRMDDFAADTHELAVPSVDLVTASGTESWGGAFRATVAPASFGSSSGIGDAAPAGRSAQMGVDVDGPLGGRKRTILGVGLRRESRLTPIASAIRLADGAFTNLSAPESDATELALRLEHYAGASHVVRADYTLQNEKRRGDALDRFDLPERAHTFLGRTSHLRVAAIGSVGGNALNEARAEVRSEEQAFHPRSMAPVTDVLGAFRGGGSDVRGSSRITAFRFSDDLDTRRGQHALRLGILVERAEHRSDRSYNSAGRFTFSSLQDLEEARPALFTRSVGDPRVDVAGVQAALYVQDHLKVGSRFSIMAGLRQELETHVPSAFNLSPRVGATVAMGSHGVLRIGAGRFHGWLGTEHYAQALRQGQQRQLIVESPSYDAAGVARPAAAREQRTEIDPQLELPATDVASVSWHRQIAAGLNTNVSLTWRHGAVFRTRSLGPSGGRGEALRLEANGKAASREFRVVASYQRPGRPLLFVNYTWSRALTDADQMFALPMDSAAPELDRGPTSDDVRHRVLAYGSVKLPGRLRLTVQSTLRSGLPYGITTGSDDNLDGVLNDRPAGVNRNSAREPWFWSSKLRVGWSMGLGGERSGERIASGEGLETLEAGHRRARINVYLEASNLFDRVNPSGFVGVRTSPLFGQPTLTSPGRRLLLGLSTDWR